MMAACSSLLLPFLTYNPKEEQQQTLLNKISRTRPKEEKRKKNTKDMLWKVEAQIIETSDKGIEPGTKNIEDDGDTHFSFIRCQPWDRGNPSPPTPEQPHKAERHINNNQKKIFGKSTKIKVLKQRKQKSTNSEHFLSK